MTKVELHEREVLEWRSRSCRTEYCQTKGTMLYTLFEEPGIYIIRSEQEENERNAEIRDQVLELCALVNNSPGGYGLTMAKNAVRKIEEALEKA